MKYKIISIICISFLLISCNNANDTAENTTEESSISDVSDVEHIKITSETCDVKEGAGEEFKSIGELKKDDKVNVLEEVEDWYIVQLDNNQVGAVENSDATPIVIEEGKDNGKKPSDAETPDNQTNDQTDTNEESEDQNIGENTNETITLTNSEQQMIDLVNSERQKNDLPELQTDLELTRVARIKSQDIVENDYFSHNSPNYGSPFDMMKSFGIDYLHAGENLAGNSNVENAHNSLMNSSGHRKNILSPNYTHIGIGIKSSDKYGYVYTQMFISKPK
ncbi:SCP-like extracellular protein [Clostridium sp. D2Q-14]|uniref:CAP domain-containing protein n=1 Tax=Anaeromonas gelatinilytica TaxID=2683194 RepID=UPI00193BC096|nr:CAP domain-containing protein [Anaeromonas gelatinilytica]MBS4534644.1 SCP-like extracellular protein [Anaeromonas gelatinilytica]